MRGNETIDGRGVSWDSLGFPIPMRGNEQTDVTCGIQAVLEVSDPHEG